MGKLEVRIFTRLLYLLNKQFKNNLKLKTKLRMPEIIIQALNGLQKDLLYILHLYQSVLDDQKHTVCNAAFYTSSDLSYQELP